MAEDKIIKEIKKEESKVVKRIKRNPWMIATIALAIILVVVFVVSMGAGVSKKTVSNNLLSFIESQTGEKASVVSINEENGMYNVTVNFKGQDVSVFVTNDGNFMAGQLIPLTATKSASASSSSGQTAAKEVPKSDKPVADFYVFSYCPYGTQMEKALVPVYNLLKSKADINIVFIGAMHGEYERVESLRQICIEKNYGKDKLFAYFDKLLVNAAVGSCRGTDSCVSPLIEAIYTQVGIDKNTVNTCMTKDADALYQADVAKSANLGISGSPSVVINGVQAQVSRSPAGVLSAICSAFNTAPAECSQTLSSTSASAGFGSTASSSSSASCG
jgi:protein-disulfide isomerase